MAQEPEVLKIYIDYDFLAAEQLGELLLQLHEVYGDILYSETPYLRQLPSAPQARLRVNAINTSNSVVIDLVHGITQVVASSDPSLVSVTGGVAALGAMGTIILRLLSRSVDLRDKWRRGNREDEASRLQIDSKRLEVEHKSQRLEAESKEVDVLDSAETQVGEQVHRDISREVLSELFPERVPEKRDELVEELVPHLGVITRLMSDSNIRQVTITLPNGES